MKKIIFTQILLCLTRILIGQPPFVLSLEQPELDIISDVVQISSRFYFIQDRINIVLPPDKDCTSDLLVTDENGQIIEQYNLNGFRTQYQRILKVVGDDIYLIGSLKTDSCKSKLVVSKFNILTHSLDHLSFLDFCTNVIEQINIIPGLNQKTYIEEYHTVENMHGYATHIFSMDSAYSLTLVIDSIGFRPYLSIDFSRTGYLIALSKLYKFYDADFNFRKQKFYNEGTSYWNETLMPFSQNLLLLQTVQRDASKPDPGIQIKLIDSNLIEKKKVILFPTPFDYVMELPFFGGLSVKNENEIWALGEYLQHPPDNDISYYSITKLDSNLNIICQHFLGHDTGYRTYGIRAFESGGAIVYGSRLREGHHINEGEDIFAIRVGENCELPATVSTHGVQEPLQSISVFPNPGINDLTFSVNGFDPTSLRVELIDELGQIVFTTKDLSKSITIPELPDGQYFYRILQKDKLLGVGPWVKQ